MIKKYQMKYKNQTLYNYCDNLRQEASLIAREIEKLDMKRNTLIDLSWRLERDIVEVTEDTPV